MAEIFNRMFGKSTRVLIKDGKFNNVQGEYHYYDQSQRMTNIGCHNVVGNTVENVHNYNPQVIYHEGNGYSTHHHSAPGGVTGTADASPTNNDAHAESTEPIFPPQLLNNTSQAQAPTLRLGGQNSSLPFNLPILTNAQFPVQYIHTRPGDIRCMNAAETAFLKCEMAQMAQELDFHFGADNEDKDVSLKLEMQSDENVEDEVAAGTRSQSLTMDIQRLTLDEHAVFQPRAQSLSADLQRLTIDEGVPPSPHTPQSDSRLDSNQGKRYPGLRDLGRRIMQTTSMTANLLHGTNAQVTSPTQSHTHVSSTSTTRVAQGGSVRHVTIQGDLIEVDNTVHEINFNSHVVANNVIQNSYTERGGNIS